jgi:aldose 1-epimerase
LYERSTKIDAGPGEDIVLRAPDAVATIDPGRGGRLASLVVGGCELLVGPGGPNDRSIEWGSYLMAPWPGRLANGRLRWRGRTIQLQRNHGRHAIHGVVFDAAWDVRARDATSAALALTFDPARWPFAGSVRQTYAIDGGGLSITAEIVAAEAMPAALGWHPWFRRRTNDARVTLLADRFLETRGLIPTGNARPVAGRTDLRAGPPLGTRRLDHAFLAAVSPATLEWPDLTLRVEFGPPLDVVTVYTPPHAICIEPQTARANALGLEPDAARAAGAVSLEAGESLAATMRLSWEPRRAG